MKREMFKFVTKQTTITMFIIINICFKNLIEKALENSLKRKHPSVTYKLVDLGF